MKQKHVIVTLFLLLMIFYSGIWANEDLLVPVEIVNNQLTSYSIKDRGAIDRDYRAIHELSFANCMKNDFEEINLVGDLKEIDLSHRNIERFYIGTVGAPGASKSTILEGFVDMKGVGDDVVYVDPDQRALRFMANTYLQELNLRNISKASSYQNLLREAYKKWRAASNYIANTILNEAYKKGCSIMHGTTSTGKNIGDLYEKLRKNDYKITLLLCVSPEKNRHNAVMNREQNQCIVQSTGEDFVEKEKMFWKKMPVYFQYADEIIFFWAENFAYGSQEVGKWSPSVGFQSNEGFELIKKEYANFCKTNSDYDCPSLDNLLSRENI